MKTLRIGDMVIHGSQESLDYLYKKVEEKLVEELAKSLEKFNEREPVVLPSDYVPRGSRYRMLGTTAVVGGDHAVVRLNGLKEGYIFEGTEEECEKYIERC